MSASLTPQQLATLRRCSRDDQAFGELCQLYETIKDSPKTPAFYHEILELQEDFICCIDNAEYFTYVNRAYADLCNLPASALIGKSFWTIVPEADVDRLRQLLQEVTRHQQPKVEDRIFHLANNTMMCIEWTNTPMFDDGGQVQGILAVGRDMTARKLAETALKESEALLRQIVENSQEVFYLYDPYHQRILYINPAYETIWGRAASEVYLNPQPFLQAVHLADLAPDPDAILIASSDTLSSYSVTRPDGTVRHLRVRHYPVKDEHDAIIQIVGIAEDVTEKIAAEKHRHDLEREREQMRLLYHFIHDVSHEFRTPLTIIYTSLHLLLRTTDAQKQQVYQERIINQITMLTRLVDDLNVMARLDSGILVTQAPVQLVALLRQMINTYQLRFPQRQFYAMFPAAPLPPFNGSETDLVVTFDHLLENALRFSQDSHPITVTLEQEMAAVVLTIADTGGGIAPQDLPHIFKRFYRSDTARTTRGFGLGLPIAKSIIELHAGTLAVTSELGSGTLVIIRLPLPTQ